MPVARPPLDLTKGHFALVLAGGFLNTVLHKEGEDPILIKATPYKQQYEASKTEETKNEGKNNETTEAVTVMSERILLKVRVALPSGEIVELKQENGNGI